MQVNFAVALGDSSHILFSGVGGICQVLVECSKCWWSYQGLMECNRCCSNV